MKKEKYPEGARVIAPKMDGSIEEGVVLDSMSSLLFIKFEEGLGEFVFRSDARLELCETKK